MPLPMCARCFVLFVVLLFAGRDAGAWSDKVTYAADAYFSRQSALLDQADEARLRDIVEKADANSNPEVFIAIGHADGREADAQALSLRRAKAVKWYLIQLGVSPRRIYTEGKGSTQPVEAGPPKNRRVEVEFVGSSAKPDDSGVRWMRQWWRDLSESDPPADRDEWTDLTPPDVLPMLEPEPRASFVQQLKLALIERQDDASLQRLLAEPLAAAPEAGPVPSALHAQALGWPHVGKMFEGQAGAIPADDRRRLHLAQTVFCNDDGRKTIFAKVERVAERGGFRAYDGPAQVALLGCARSAEELAWLVDDVS